MKHGVKSKVVALVVCGLLGAWLAPACGVLGSSAGAGGAGGAGGSAANGAGAGGDQAILQQELDNDQEGGLTCANPDDCVNKCVAESKFCSAAHAVHPYKPPMVGDLYQCIDSFPKAASGGSYTCLYRYPNGDACIFAYAAKLGPITIPAPPPLCVYKG